MEPAAKRLTHARAPRMSSARYHAAFVLRPAIWSRTMPEQANAEEARIKSLLEGWADSVRRHDLPAILAHHERDMVMFDLPPPLQCRGIEAYKQTWDLFFRYHKVGTAFDIRELAITAGADVAFAAVIMWCGPDSSSDPKDKDGFLFRLTVGLRKVDGDWRIAHEHHSVPATD
jgi:ketosteroid isomerase-like protein